LKAFRIILVIALFLTIVIPASTSIGFYNGNRYLKFSEDAKIAYVAGLSDMADTLTEYYEPEKYKKLCELTKDMIIGQLVKILDRYLEEHPEELHLSVAITFLYALDEIVYKE